MKRSRLLWGTGLFLVAASLLVMGASGVGGSSSLSAGPHGWLAARLYLEEGGVTSTLLDRPLPESLQRGEVGPVLVLAFPLARALSSEERDALRGYLATGGTVVAAYGDLPEADPAQARFFAGLGASVREAREPAPLGPFAWRRWMRREWHLTPDGGSAGEAGRALEVAAPTRYPAPGELDGARVLYRAPTGAPKESPPEAKNGPETEAREGRPSEAERSEEAEPHPSAVWVAPVEEGRLVVLPAGVLSNAYVERPGNADLLESLRVWLGDEWTFDEYHHGLVHPELVAARGSSLAFDLFAAHLFLLYLLGLWTLARPFGPPWREPRLRTGSAGSFLRGLGRLHDSLGHHAQAAQRLVQRARELDPRLRLPDEREADLATRAADADADALVALGREMAELRRRRGET